jgi:urease accessory protein
MNMNTRFARCRSLLPAVLLVIFAASASAHPGHAAHDITGIGWGLAHPFSGLDHLLAMIAVGLWAVQMGGRALWMLPVSFVGAMGAGAALGMNGAVLPQLEPLVLGSVLVLGSFVAMSTRLSLGVSAAMVSAVAVLHGQAHGAELPAGANGWMAAIGFLAATVLLQGSGIAGGKLMQKAASSRALRRAGAVIAIVALLLGLQVL